MPMLGDASPRFWVFAAFVAMVFVLGGGSRDDIASLVVLRPACALFAAYALSVAAPGDFARLRMPLLLLVALALWMVVQLVPLPPSVWGALPGRGSLLEVDKLIGIEGTWRPISLSPSKTINSLACLVVPLTGLLLYGIQSGRDRQRVLGLLVLAAAASALLGLGQFASGGNGPLYLYRFTNLGAPVGLFANRNHNAVFLATIFVIAGYMLAEHRRTAARGSLGAVAVGGVCMLILVTLLFSQSRAGLLIGLLALGLGAVLYIAARRAEQDEDHHRRGFSLVRHWPIVLVGLVVVAALGFVVTQSSSVDRLVSHSPAEEIRVQVFPQIAAMASDNWLLGTGFGSFEYAYRAHEASAWLNTTYLNNAHDDWLQWVIEGGLPAILIFLVFGLWLAGAAIGHWRAREQNAVRTGMAAMAVGVLMLLLVASALDYPLRVPSIMLYAVLMIALVADPPEPQTRAGKRKGRDNAKHRPRGVRRSEWEGAVQ